MVSLVLVSFQKHEEMRFFRPSGIDDVCRFSSCAFSFFFSRQTSRHVGVVSEWKPHHQSCLHSKIVTITKVHLISEIPISCEFDNHHIISHHFISYHIISTHFLVPMISLSLNLLGLEALSIHFHTVFFVPKTGVFFYRPFPPKSRHSQGRLTSSMRRSAALSPAQCKTVEKSRESHIAVCGIEFDTVLYDNLKVICPEECMECGLVIHLGPCAKFSFLGSSDVDFFWANKKGRLNIQI